MAPSTNPDRFDRQMAFLAVGISLVAFLATALQALYAWQSYSLSKSLGDRPVVLPAGLLDVAVERSRNEVILTYTFRLRNCGSGNAYNIRCYAASQIPPLYYDALTKQQVLSSLDQCRKAFTQSLTRDGQSLVMGGGSEIEVRSIERFLAGPDGRTRHKKYIAAFYESEGHKPNAGIASYAIEFDGNGSNLTVELTDHTVVNDPRI